MTLTRQSLCVGKLSDTFSSLATDLCQHVLIPLLRLHPGRVAFQAQTLQSGQDDLPGVEVSFGPEEVQQQQEGYTVEDTTLECLKAFTGKCSQVSTGYSLQAFHWKCPQAFTGKCLPTGLHW